jgi:TonB family protein
MSQGPIFASLPGPERKQRWSSFVFSYAVQGLAVLIVLSVGILRPEVMPKREYRLVTLVTVPPPVRPAPKIEPAKVVTPPPRMVVQEARLIAPRPRLERPRPEPEPPKIVAAQTMPELPKRNGTPGPLRIIRTNLFSTGSSATATLPHNTPIEKVQTGGFGDPNGVPASGNSLRPNIAQLGSFDLPPGPGYGNGTGGARGLRGTVASTGFGNGTAIGDGGSGGGLRRAAVQQGGFGDSQPPVAEAKPRKVDAPKGNVAPVEIVAKPKPAYTEEARQLRIEGEVLLEVVFTSSGRLQVVRVIRGLGHGLDENAIRAAEQIRYKPAHQDGQPVDSTATLHIIFQLA